MAVCCVLVKTASLAVMCCLIWNRRGNEGWWEDTGQGGREEKRGSGRKYGSYQHSPRQENRAMMKAKSREEGKDWQAQTDREWRLKWQRDKQAGVQREWGGEKWTAAMKQETKKRQRERQTDRQTYRQTDRYLEQHYQTQVNSPRGPPAFMAADKRRGSKTDVKYEQRERVQETTDPTTW